MKNAYVTALTESILAGLSVEQALMNVKAVMQRKGHLRLWSQVLRATKRVLESRLISVLPQVTVAKERLVNQELIKSALIKLGAAEVKDYSVAVDSSLVGGFVARYKGQLLDTSYKQALLKLYRTVSKS